MPELKPRSNTAEEILDIAEMLIQTRGYNAFSYQDIATQLGIRKASIHYHFPTKTTLGIAVIERYIAHNEAILNALIVDDTATSMHLFECYTGPYVAFAETPDRVCLCGALTGEFHALPTEVRKRVAYFCVSHQAWLSRILKRGLRRGEFHFSVPANRMAATIFGALQGALLVQRATGNVNHLSDTISVLKAQLQPR